jgi:hypothetical protein
MARASPSHPKGSDHLYLGKAIAAAGIGNFVLSYVTFFNATLTFIVALHSVLLPLITGMKISLPLVDARALVTESVPECRIDEAGSW